MADDGALLALMRTITSTGDEATVARSLTEDPGLARAALGTGATRQDAERFFFADHGTHVYAGDTALHVAAFAYDVPIAHRLVAAGADVQARNRRGAAPLHSAAIGSPGSPAWDPDRQAATVAYLVAVGADPDVAAADGVTPLHRAVRNRCTAAVRALLEAGADPTLANRSGSTPLALARATTGRTGSGSPEARTEQARIIELLTAATAR
ncbi:MAG: ankyrin repeat domain-containing protein [Actinomycetota bacterium]